ncbi:MAG: M48 family metallopeptidase [Tannerellaceae bacterium]
MNKSQHIHPELGTIELSHSKRAKNYIIKLGKNGLIATIPHKGSIEELNIILQKNKAKLVLWMKHKETSSFRIDNQTILNTLTFSLQVSPSDNKRYTAYIKESILHLHYPSQIDLYAPSTQETLRNIIVGALKHEAKLFLPSRLKMLAEKFKFRYNDVRIKDVKTRWGSCSSHKNINLSFRLMLLPIHLVDYVLLHELCHTIELNHSDRFWRLMDKTTNGTAKLLRAELKQFRIVV